MILTNTRNNQKDSGFTIVELLVVIVVIGVLAAITVVSYTGITNKANLAAAQSAANNVAQKAQAYVTQVGTNTFPTTFGTLSTAATTEVYRLEGVTLAGTALAAKPASPSVVNYYVCGPNVTNTVTPTTLPGTAASTAISTVVGIRVAYWNYNGTGVIYRDEGNTSATVTVGATTYQSACLLSTT